MTVRTAELLMAIALALLSLTFIVKISELNIGWVQGRGPGAGAWPFVLGMGMLACCLLTIYRWFRRATPEARSTDIFMSRSAVNMVGVTVLALVLLLIGLHIIGIYLALFLFLFFFIRIFGGHGWIATIAITLLTPVVVFCLFEWALTIPLPKGLPSIEWIYYPLYDLIY